MSFVPPNHVEQRLRVRAAHRGYALDHTDIELCRLLQLLLEQAPQYVQERAMELLAGDAP